MDTRIAGAREGDVGLGQVLAGDVGLHVVAAVEKKGRNEDWFRGGRTLECLEMMKGKMVNEREKKINIYWWIRVAVRGMT